MGIIFCNIIKFTLFQKLYIFLYIKSYPCQTLIACDFSSVPKRPLQPNHYTWFTQGIWKGSFCPESSPPLPYTSPTDRPGRGQVRQPLHPGQLWPVPSWKPTPVKLSSILGWCEPRKAAFYSFPGIPSYLNTTSVGGGICGGLGGTALLEKVCH